MCLWATVNSNSSGPLSQNFNSGIWFPSVTDFNGCFFVHGCRCDVHVGFCDISEKRTSGPQSQHLRRPVNMIGEQLGCPKHTYWIPQNYYLSCEHDKCNTYPEKSIKLAPSHHSAPFYYVTAVLMYQFLYKKK